MLTVPETISHSSDMVNAHHNLNDLTMPLSVMVRHLWALALATVKLQNLKSLHHLLQRYESRYKMSKMARFGVVRHSRSLEIAPVDRARVPISVP